MFYFILFYDICSDITGEHDTRINNQMEDSSQHWTSPEDGLLLGRTLRKEKKKIVHVSWENLYYLHTVNMHGTQNIKITIDQFPLVMSVLSLADF